MNPNQSHSNCSNSNSPPSATMIKGLAITPPVIGRISIGRMVEKNGKRLPEKDDSFTLTTQAQNRDGWILHPLHQVFAEASPNNKIRAIPVRVLFNDADLNLRAEYSAFDRTTGRPLCVGNGETARRVSKDGMEELGCPSPERCPFAKTQGCKLYGRLNIAVDGQNDELGSFMFRTTGYNSVRTLAARLKYFEAVSGGNTRYLPLLLRLRAKSTTQSHRAPVYYVDLTLREEDNLANAVQVARSEAERHFEAGVDTVELESVAKHLLANGQFEDGEDEVPLLLEEFYPETLPEGSSSAGAEGAAEVAAANAAPPAPRPMARATRLSNKLGSTATATPSMASSVPT